MLRPSSHAHFLTNLPLLLVNRLVEHPPNIFGKTLRSMDVSVIPSPWYGVASSPEAFEISLPRECCVSHAIRALVPSSNRRRCALSLTPPSRYDPGRGRCHRSKWTPRSCMSSHRSSRTTNPSQNSWIVQRALLLRMPPVPVSWVAWVTRVGHLVIFRCGML